MQAFHSYKDKLVIKASPVLELKLFTMTAMFRQNLITTSF